jgi:hypothetical protein
MRLFLVLLTVALITLVSNPAQAQTASGDQYNSSGEDQYGSSGVGGDAADVAMMASSAFGDAPEDGGALAAEKALTSDDLEPASVEESAETKVADTEEGVAIESLPETGGTSPLSLGILLVAGGVLIRTLTRLAFAIGD